MEFTLKPKPAKKSKPDSIIPSKSFKAEKSDSDSDEIKKTNKDLIKSSLFYQSQNSQLFNALSEDPTIICYDLYKTKAEQEKKSEEIHKGAKYHENIKQHADFKKRERMILKERYESKLRELEKEEFGETEEYFTQSYIEFMKQNKIFEAQLDKIDKQSELTSIGCKNPDTFLNRLTTPDPLETITKKPKTSEIIDQLPIIASTPTTNKRTESQLQNARDRYLVRKSQKLNNK